MSKSNDKGNKPAQNNKLQDSEKISKEADIESSEKHVESDLDDVVESLKDTEEIKPVDKMKEQAGDKKTVSAKDIKKEANAGFRELPFIEKCKKDPVIFVSLALVVVVIAVAAIYFILPNAKTPSMGMTLEDFKTGFNEAEVAQSLLNNGIDFRYGNVPYVDPDTDKSILGDKVAVTGDRKYVDYFAGPSRSVVNSGIEGATRKNDGELAFVRVYIEYGEDVNPVWMLLSNTLQALYPELRAYDAMELAMQKMGEYNGDLRFYVRGDYGFRIVPVQQADVTYIVIDVVPKAAINDSQIREILTLPVPTIVSSETSVETSVAST